MEPDEEQAVIRRSLDILERATGQRPTGWISPVTAFTLHTRKFLAAEKLLWHGDARDTDLPSVVETEGGSIVQIPGSDFTDNRTLRSSPQDIWDVYKETFDYLRAHEAPGILALSMHCHFGGRPMIAAVYEKIFGYMRQHNDVWFTSFGEIARWVMDTQRNADTHARRLLKSG
jgi:peptidoglycan/xylan/chitin deacetylase (PgdA/CDA1 family)